MRSPGASKEVPNELTISRWECGVLRPSPEALERFYALVRTMKQTGIVLAG